MTTTATTPMTTEQTSLADKMLSTLRTQRGQGTNAYPLTLRRLGQLADPEAKDKDILNAAGQESFAAVAVAARKSLDGLVALREDKAELASSPLVLQAVLELICSEDKPVWTVAKAAAKLDPDLQEVFVESTQRMIQEGRLPESIGSRPGKSGPELFLKRLPPPPPPRKPEVVLAERFLEMLKTQGRPGGAAFPLSVKRLAEMSEAADEKVLKKALAQPLFAEQIVVALKAKSPEAPLALKEDVAALAASARLMEMLLDANRKDDNHAHPPADLVKFLNPVLKEAFETAKFPENVGTVIHRGKRLVFLKKDMNRPLPPPKPAAPPMPMPTPEEASPSMTPEVRQEPPAP